MYRRPVAFVGGLGAGGVAPPAHLHDAYEQQRVDAQHAGRHGDAAQLGRAPAGVAEVEGPGERAHAGVDPRGGLDGEVRQDPVSRGKRSRGAGEEAGKARHADCAP